MRTRQLVIAVLLAMCVPAAAQSQQRPINLLRPGGWAQGGAHATDMRIERIRSTDHGDGIRIVIARAADPFYAIQAVQTLAAGIPEGDRVRLRFWARSETRNPLRAVIEKTDAPFTAIAEWSGVLTGDWTSYSMTGVSPGFGANGLSVRLQAGHAAGALELAGLAVERLGPDPAMAAARAALQPSAIQDRIRRFRMGDLIVKATGRDGKPLKNASVRIEQTRHAFLFGCNIFLLEPAVELQWQKDYQTRFTDLFNFATLPFYWGAFEPEPGKPQYARLDAMARWCAAHNLVAKGHPLIWHEVWPGWAPKTADESIPLLRKRVADILGRYKSSIRVWDVVNEGNNAQDYPQTGQGNWIRRDGSAAVVETALRWARESAGPNTTLLYNDFNTTEKNVGLLSTLRSRGALPDAVGVQSHMHGGPWPLEQAWATAQRFGQFGRPVHFTETTVISGEKKSFDYRTPPTSWPSTEQGEREQADYLAQFYTVLYSHPAVRAITYWDLSDRGAWLNAPAGLVRTDMSPKPAYTQLRDLIRRAWWTDKTILSDPGGQVRARATYGDYRITVTDAKGRTAVRDISFPMGSGRKIVEIRMP